jgi:hypothetical protein
MGTPLAAKKKWAGVVARREPLSPAGIDFDGFNGPDA